MYHTILNFKTLLSKAHHRQLWLQQHTSPVYQTQISIAAKAVIQYGKQLLIRNGQIITH